jgi:5'-nucleotidase/UDP-sugar diphosphatase
MRLAEQVPGIDLIVDGHTHTRMTEPLFVTNSATKRPVPIVQAWQWGLEVGKTDLEISAQNTVKTRYKAIPVNLKNVTKNPDGTKTETPIGTQVAGNAALRAELQPYADKVDQILGEKIGTAAEDFETTTLRSQENPLGNLVADATFAYAKKLGADFVVQNSGSIRAPIKAGPITKKNPYEILPYDNSTVLLTVRGKTVREMFDFVASLPAGVPNFLQIAGAKVTIDRKQKRATSILIAGAPLVDGKNYRLATNSYLVTGGDGFAMLKAAKDPFDTSTFMRDLMIDYIKGQKRPLVPRVDGRIRIVE